MLENFMFQLFVTKVNPNCVEALCGRGFMRLALGEEHECVEDMVAACDLDIYTVTAHINVLPDEAKKLLLFWLGKSGYKNCLVDLETNQTAFFFTKITELLHCCSIMDTRRPTISEQALVVQPQQ